MQGSKRVSSERQSQTFVEVNEKFSTFLSMRHEYLSMIAVSTTCKLGIEKL
jgi:hypothetical protein